MPDLMRSLVEPFCFVIPGGVALPGKLIPEAAVSSFTQSRPASGDFFCNQLRAHLVLPTEATYRHFVHYLRENLDETFLFDFIALHRDSFCATDDGRIEGSRV